MTATRSCNAESIWWKIGALFTIKIMGALFALQVFDRFSPLVDSKLYLTGYYAADPLLRTQLVHKLAIMLNDVGGAFFSHVMFGMISTAGVIYYIATGGRRWALLLLLLLPSAFIWTSIVGKEALYFGCFSLLLVIWSKYTVEKLNATDLLVGLLALCICAILRPHYGIAIVWLFGAASVIKRFGEKSWGILLALFILAALAIYFFVWTDLLTRGFSAIESTGRASRYSLFNIEPHTDFGFERFKCFVPLGLILGIVGPLPSELFARLEFLPFFLEGVFILLAPMLIYRYAIRREFEEKALFCRIYLWCIVPALLALMILHAPFGLMNPGSATRWRVNFESLFYMAPLLLLFHFTDKNRNENSSLSS